MPVDDVHGGNAASPPRESAEDVAVWLDEALGLQLALGGRATIEQAKGILMLRFGIHPDAAFRFLGRVASVREVGLLELATRVTAIGRRDSAAIELDPVLTQLLLEPTSTDVPHRSAEWTGLGHVGG